MYDLGHRKPRIEPMQNFSLLRTLPYAGALPFLAGALAKFSSTLPTIIYLTLFVDVTHLVLSYGLMIVSFMAGVHWGQYLSGARPQINLLLSSNAVALAAWAAYILMQPFYVCFVFAGLIALLYLIDTKLHLDVQYLQTRRNVSILVCGSLLLLAFN
jgi:Protein of unknown function (DUF3429)